MAIHRLLQQTWNVFNGFRAVETVGLEIRAKRLCLNLHFRGVCSMVCMYTRPEMLYARSLAPKAKPAPKPKPNAVVVRAKADKAKKRAVEDEPPSKKPKKK